MNALRQVFNDHPKAIVFAAGALLRLLTALLFPSLPDLLTLRPEISTPVNSFRRLKEGSFLYERGLDPYDGGIFHQAPLFLSLFSLMPDPSFWIGRLVSILLYTGLDVLSADCLYSIAESGAAHTTRSFQSPRKARTWKPLSVAAIYLFNPYTLLACLGRPTTVFATAFTLLSISHACQRQTVTAAFALAFAAYVSLHPLLLLPPVGLLCYDRLCMDMDGSHDSPPHDETSFAPTTNSTIAVDQRAFPKAIPFALRFAATFAIFLALLLGLSRLLLPSWKFIPSVYLTALTLPDLTPNPGLWWYFFIEMFDAFRSFFLGVFALHMLSYSVPFCLRFQKQPLTAVVLMMGIIAIFEPYANAGTAGAWLSALCLLSHLFELSSLHRYTFPAMATLLYSTFLGPAFHHLWIYAGSGNANFFYAITLVWSLALLIILTDTVYSALRDEWEAERPEGKGKDVGQI
ncbi:hypothetical protein LTR62_007551 [Meristemomyces frigidus]|uniref:GPI transamidase subunit PIG-U n=1 Tax=Meristemomyces frigidus TaxID=1508187 RepID=A0AAN7TMA0_9PEZI|nr:hypothetical protein LTR62_007551 [Meristemomyces frigidus]